MNSRSAHAVLACIGALLSLAFFLAACTDEEVIYVERVLFDEPPPAALGFLGYDERGEKLTTCGNCHVGQQSRWETTAHAGAWATLQASGSAQGLCEGCHTVGALGNAEDENSGYASTQDARYEDVQCESCHGAGLAHVSAPDGITPLASIVVASDPAVGCAECHQGSHHPFVEEWEQSKHADVNAYVRNAAQTNPASNGACLDCHSAQGALKAWGVDTRYIEENAPVASHVGIVCAVCHDPHSNVNAGQLRFPIDVPSEEEQLCMKCHHKRASPDIQAAVFRGPHSPEGPLLLGDAGWWPPGFDESEVVTSHGPAGNPKLCATCHVSAFTVTDPISGAFQFQATGHLFEAIPCLDAGGIPVPGGNCDVSERSFGACASSGCHGSPAVAEGLYEFAIDTITDLVNQVDGLLAQVPAGELDNDDGRFTVADGSWFNARLGELPGSPIHNPFLMEQLLRASITALQDEYGLMAASELPPKPLLGR